MKISITFITMISLLPLHGCAWNSQPMTLQLLQILHVHGECSLDQTNPTEDKLETIGTAQLTNAGKQEQLDLGLHLRHNYNDFLGDVYNRSAVVARSSDYDKTLTSASCVLAGLFPPKEEQIWNNDILWQPIPVHTVPNHMDYLLDITSHCELYDQLFNEQTNNEKETVFLEKLKNITKLDTIEFKEMGLIAEYIMFSKNQIIEWTTENTHSIAELAKQAARRMFETRKQQFLKSGLFLREVIENIERKLINSDDEKDLFLYTSNDLFLHAFTSLLNLTHGTEHIGSTNTALVIELLQAPDKTDFIRFLYRNDTTVMLKEIQMPGCETPCKWKTFVKRTKTSVPSDIASECKPKVLTENSKTARGSLLDFRLITFVGTATIVTIGIIAAVLSKLRNNRHHLRLRSSYKEIK